MRLALAIVAVALSSVAAFAQTTTTTTAPAPRPIPVAVDPPPDYPELRVPREQRIPLLRQYVAGNAPVRDRFDAYRRMVGIYAATGDQRGADQARAEWRAFIQAEAQKVEAEWARNPPPPVSLCDPPASVSAPSDPVTLRRACGRDFSADNIRAADYDIVARAAELSGDQRKRFQMEEVEFLLSWATAPDAHHWPYFAREASLAGEHETAVRLCNMGVTQPLYARGYLRSNREDAARCEADVRFRMGAWAGWLAFYETRVTAPDGTSIDPRMRLCVAATRAVRADLAQRACDLAEQSIALGAAREAERVEAIRNRPPPAILPNYRDVGAEAWRMRKGEYEKIVAGCRAMQQRAQSRRAADCAGPPELPPRRLY